MKALILAALLVAAPRVADACSCSEPGVEVLPKGSDVPTNARVRVFLPPGDWATDVSTVTVKLMEKRAASAAAPVAAKKKKGKTKAPPPPPPPKAVDTDRADLGSGRVRVVELVPRAELAKKTKYVVTLAVPGGRDEVVGEFTTGDAADATPPAWNGVKKATWREDDRAAVACVGPRFALLEVEEMAEPAGAIYAIWIGGEDGKVDYARPPATYVPARGKALRLGEFSTCSPRNLDLPKRPEVVVGVRLIDAAGNEAETAGEAVLRLVKK